MRFWLVLTLFAFLPLFGAFQFTGNAGFSVDGIKGTLYLLNGDNADYDDYGSLNFKFFHQHGWGGEEAGNNYEMIGLNIYGSPGITKLDGTTDQEKGNWIAKTDPIDGIYRITLDLNKMTTTYEKVR